MVNNNKESEGLAGRLRKKEQIEKEINERYSKYVTIMFTDIAGYTSFVETHGDMAAKSLLQIHNDIIFPIIEEHDGRVIKTIGDAIMAAYDVPEKGVKAAVAIQTTLKEHNKTAGKLKKINIRIGLHAGKAMQGDDGDYFGDAVNVAARIEPAGSAGQILVSSSVFSAVKDISGIFCEYFGEKQAKGKALPIALYRVFLNEQEMGAFLEKRQAEQEAEEKAKADREKQVSIGSGGAEQIKDESAHAGIIPGNKDGVSFAQDTSILTDTPPDKDMGDSKDVVFSPARSPLRFDLLWKVSIPVLLVVLLLFVYPGFLNMNGDSGSVLKRYVEGFNYLRHGDFEQARSAFVEIGMDDARCQEGLAALAYKSNSFEEADKFCNRSMELEPGVLYARVVKGNIHFDNARFDKAKEYYEEALGLSTPLKWQKGEALYRLGRISSSENNPSRALEYYNQAVSLDEQNVDIITAKGSILEKMGELTKALEAFREAQSLAPDDAYIKAFYRRARQKIQAGEDKEHQERIDSLVKDLIAAMEKSDSDPVADTWTTRPATLFFTRQNRSGAISLREGEDEFFEFELVETLRASNAVDIVERELLDKLLQELKLSSTDLVNPATALRLGRIMSARLIGSIRLLGFGQDTKVYVKLIETETSAVKVNASGNFGISEPPETAAEKIGTSIAEKIRSAFPVRGRINNIEDNTALLNIGSLSGVKKEMVMRVFSQPAGASPDPVLDSSPNPSDKKNFAGALKIISVDRNTSQGEIIKGAENIALNCRVEAVSS